MARLRHLVSESLVRNSLALMTTTVVTSGFGFFFWAVAAHRYNTTILGRTTALIAAANVVAIIAQLNLSSVLGRFLPTAGTKSAGFVKNCYIASIALVLLLTAGFLALDIGHRYLEGQTRFELLFVLASVLLLLGVLQDSVLIALRKSPVMLVENCTISFVRLVLVVVLAPVLPTTGVVVASVLPSVIGAPIIGLYIYRVLVPRHERDSVVPSNLPPFRRLLYFVGAAASRSVVATGTTLCLPLIVTATRGLRAAAYFNLPWLINTSFGGLLSSVSLSYVVQARFDREAKRETLRRAMKIGMWVIIAGTVLETLAAPLLLHLLGPRFASQGTTLMRLLGVATPFSAPVVIYQTFNSLDQKVWRLVVLEVAYSILLLTLTPVFLRHYGVAGAGWSYLIAEGVFGIGSIPPAVRYLRNHQRQVAAAELAASLGMATPV